MYDVYLFSETDGLWAAWSNYTVCSKSCAGRQMRVRACTKLRPAGDDRACAGDGAQYKMCEVKGAECAGNDVDYFPALRHLAVGSPDGVRQRTSLVTMWLIVLAIDLLNVLFIFLIHLNLELLTRFPISNDEKHVINYEK